MSGEHQVNVKSQSELDIGGRETCCFFNDQKFQTLSFAMYFAVSWFEPRLVINKTALEWFEAKTGPPDVSWIISRDKKNSLFFLQQVNESPENLKYLWYPELEIYGLETFGRQRVLKEMSGVRIMKNKTINYELGCDKIHIPHFPHALSFLAAKRSSTRALVLCPSVRLSVRLSVLKLNFSLFGQLMTT